MVNHSQRRCAFGLGAENLANAPAGSNSPTGVGSCWPAAVPARPLGGHSLTPPVLPAASTPQVLLLVPTASSRLLPLLVSNFPHKLRDRNTQCLYLRAAFALAEGRGGSGLREGLLAGVVEHLIGLDVEIRCVRCARPLRALCSAAGGGGACGLSLTRRCRQRCCRRVPGLRWLALACPPRSSCLPSFLVCRWEDIAETAAAEEAKEEEGGLPAEEEPDIFELEGEQAGWAASVERGARMPFIYPPTYLLYPPFVCLTVLWLWLTLCPP